MINEWKKEWKDADVLGRINTVLLGLVASGMVYNVILVASGYNYP
jgi:hypothetical protein